MEKLNSLIEKYSSNKYRWFALVVISSGLAIVIIDATVLNVSIPYMLRDLNANISDIQWVISGYSLTIASLLITVGRLGDMWGRKRLFLIGTLIFVAGSFISSIAETATVIIIGRGIIQATGAAFILTSALSIIASEFQGKDRALAFGVWGSVAGAAATIGPLLGGYLTTYYSWRWSLRINVFVGLITILGSVFIKESRGLIEKGFDYIGTLLSAIGLFGLVFSFIEGRKYGWINPNNQLSLFGINWPLKNISVIPFILGIGIISILAFVFWEYRLTKRNGSPLLEISMFRNKRFSLTAMLLSILSYGQFGVFFILPIYFENVLGYDALKTGEALLSTTISIFVVGIISGFIARKVDLKWIVLAGMIFIALGTYLIGNSLEVNSTAISLAPSLVVFGVGFGLAGSQLNNLMLSSAPIELAGEASGISTTMRQIGSALGVAVIGASLVTSLSSNLKINIQSDNNIPQIFKEGVIPLVQQYDIEGGNIDLFAMQLLPRRMANSLVSDIDNSLVESSKNAIDYGLYFILLALFIAAIMPKEGKKKNERESFEKNPNKKLMRKEHVIFSAS
jgi:EmrB/QacA subfamily drug resistance transporter